MPPQTRILVQQFPVASSKNSVTSWKLFSMSNIVWILIWCNKIRNFNSYNCYTKREIHCLALTVFSYTKVTFKFTQERWNRQNRNDVCETIIKTLEIGGRGKLFTFDLRESTRKINTNKLHTNTLFSSYLLLAVCKEAHQEGSKSLNQILIPLLL